MAWRGTSPNRTRGRTWQRIRNAVLSDEPICRTCIALGRVTKSSTATICDHIVSLADGGTDARSNLQGLCKRHSDEKTAAEAARAQGRQYHPKRRYGLDGWPIE